MVEGSGPLPDAHRFAFLQAMIEKRWLPEREAKTLFAELANLAGDSEFPGAGSASEAYSTLMLPKMLLTSYL